MYEPLKERMNNGAKAQQPPKQLDGVALLAAATAHAPPSKSVVLSELSAVALMPFPPYFLSSSSVHNSQSKQCYIDSSK